MTPIAAQAPPMRERNRVNITTATMMNSASAEYFDATARLVVPARSAKVGRVGRSTYCASAASAASEQPVARTSVVARAPCATTLGESATSAAPTTPASSGQTPRTSLPHVQRHRRQRDRQRDGERESRLRKESHLRSDAQIRQPERRQKQCRERGAGGLERQRRERRDEEVEIPERA